MSSILEALKQMEGDEGPQAETFRRVTQEKRGHTWSLLVAVFAAGVGAAVAVVSLVQRADVPTAQAQEAMLVEGAEPVSRLFRVVAPTVEPVARPIQRRSVEKPLHPVAEPPMAVHMGNEPLLHTEVLPEEAPVPVAANPKLVKKVETVSLPLVDPERFHIQGVRWSQTPHRRIAVINSQILREGAKVGGAKVVSIVPDGVILEVKGIRQFLSFAGR